MSRRTFSLAAAAALSGLAVSRPADAQVSEPRPPTVETSDPKEIGEGVWILPDHRVWLVPNIGIIVGRDAALVVDCGLGPANGEKVFDVARRIAGSRKLFLTLTHFHPEHGYGAQVFRPDATIVYNQVQRDELQQKGASYIDLFVQSQSKAAAEALAGTQIVMPHFIYSGDRAQIDLGGRTVELHNWGTGHTRGDQIVFIPDERILFAGDLIEERMFPIFPWFPPNDTDVDSSRWVDVLNGFQRFSPRLIVPGHGDAGGIDIALNLARHIETVGGQIRKLRASGKSASDILAEYKPQIISAYPTWEHPGLLDWEINYFASQPE